MPNGGSQPGLVRRPTGSDVLAWLTIFGLLLAAMYFVLDARYVGKADAKEARATVDTRIDGIVSRLDTLTEVIKAQTVATASLSCFLQGGTWLAGECSGAGGHVVSPPKPRASGPHPTP